MFCCVGTTHRHPSFPKAFLLLRSVEVFSDEESGKDSSDGEPDKESSAAKTSHKRTDCARSSSRTLHPETSTKLQTKSSTVIFFITNLRTMSIKGWLKSLPVPSFEDFCGNVSHSWFHLHSLSVGRQAGKCGKPSLEYRQGTLLLNY